MKLILREDVPSLGTIGDVVNVKDGYARNYLLPRSLAIVANESNTRQMQHQQRVLQNRKEKMLADYRDLAKKIAKCKISLSKQVGEEDKIFGTITSQELAEQLEQQGISVSRRKITLPESINKVGKYTAEVKLHAEVTAELNFSVVAQESAAE